jgi:hypothetical protein
LLDILISGFRDLTKPPACPSPRCRLMSKPCGLTGRQLVSQELPRHVSVGSLFGIGLIARKANVGVVLGIVLAWLLTLPCAALISGIVYWLVGRVGTA